MNDLLIFLGLVSIGFFIGRRREKEHFESIVKREKSLLHLPVFCDSHSLKKLKVQSGELVSGAVAISPDYFKIVASQIRNFFGGNVSVYESLLDRARREAVLRMKEEALAQGAHQVINMRLETSSISGDDPSGRNQVAGVEVFAYGTAIKL